MDEFFDFLEGADPLIVKFEAYLTNGSEAYFDLSEIEHIVEYYLQVEDYKAAQKATEYGLTIHPGSLEIRLKQAQVDFESGYFKQSLEKVNTLIEAMPHNEETYLLKAHIFVQLEDSKSAIKYFKKAAELMDGYDKLAVYMEINAEYQVLGNFKKALRELKSLYAQYPEESEVVYELAVCADLLGYHEDAIQYYHVFLDLDPFSHIAWYNLGNVYCKCLDFENAIKAFDYALAIKEDLGSALFNKGNALSHLGRHKEAIETFEETIQIEGCEAMTLYYIGENYEKLGNPDKAYSFYQHAAEIDPEIPEPSVGMAIIKDRQGDIEAAVRHLELAVIIDKANCSNWIMLGNAYEKTNMFKPAEKAYKKAIKVNKHIYEAWIDYANLLSKQDRHIEAIQLLLKGIKTCNNHRDIMEYRLVAYLIHNGQKEEALDHLKEALQINFGGHKDLLEYCPELSGSSEVIDLIKSYKEL